MRRTLVETWGAREIVREDDGADKEDSESKGILGDAERV
jgi:hypothetical protein